MLSGVLKCWNVECGISGALRSGDVECARSVLSGVLKDENVECVMCGFHGLGCGV